RLGIHLEAHAAGEHLREIRNIFGPPQAVRQIFSMMTSTTAEDWSVIARRMARVPAAYRSWTQTLEEGTSRGLLAAPLQVRTVIDQLTEWADTQWWHGFVSAGPAEVQGELVAAADTASAGTVELRDYLHDTYLPATEGTPNAVGAARYRLNARRWMGADLDLEEAYAWGWSEHQQINAQMKEVAEQIRPGATPVEAMRHLDEHGEIVVGVEEVRQRLQQMMDQAIEDLDGTHFDIAEPIRRVEAMIAPAGSAAAPYYSRPSIDFSRPGRTWLPTMGRTEFPMYDLVSTWYHEGVPGHHLQLAQWVHVAPQLSVYQTSLGSSSGATEGWALYAERLMDELGYLD